MYIYIYIHTLFKSFTSESGVRQGCPLSGILFAMAIDFLLRRIHNALKLGHGVVRGYADDTAVVIEDFIRDLPFLCRLFCDFEKISGLAGAQSRLI